MRRTEDVCHETDSTNDTRQTSTNEDRQTKVQVVDTPTGHTRTTTPTCIHGPSLRLELGLPGRRTGYKTHEHKANKREEAQDHA